MINNKTRRDKYSEKLEHVWTTHFESRNLELVDILTSLSMNIYPVMCTRIPLPTQKFIPNEAK